MQKMESIDKIFWSLESSEQKCAISHNQKIRKNLRKKQKETQNKNNFCQNWKKTKMLASPPPGPTPPLVGVASGAFLFGRRGVGWAQPQLQFNLLGGGVGSTAACPTLSYENQSPGRVRQPLARGDLRVCHRGRSVCGAPGLSQQEELGCGTWIAFLGVRG